MNEFDKHTMKMNEELKDAQIRKLDIETENNCEYVRELIKQTKNSDRLYRWHTSLCAVLNIISTVTMVILILSVLRLT